MIPLGVAVRAVKHGQGFDAVNQIAMDGIRARHMSAQNAERSRLRGEMQGDVIGVDAVG
jgi:hypothetical protein